MLRKEAGVPVSLIESAKTKLLKGVRGFSGRFAFAIGLCKESANRPGGGGYMASSSFPIYSDVPRYMTKTSHFLRTQGSGRQ